MIAIQLAEDAEHDGRFLLNSGELAAALFTATLQSHGVERNKKERPEFPEKSYQRVYLSSPAVEDGGRRNEDGSRKKETQTAEGRKDGGKRRAGHPRIANRIPEGAGSPPTGPGSSQGADRFLPRRGHSRKRGITRLLFGLPPAFLGYKLPPEGMAGDESAFEIFTREVGSVQRSVGVQRKIANRLDSKQPRGGIDSPWGTR